jgi:hypothetical protein
VDYHAQSLDAREHRVKLERLLNSSFKYLGMYELREVPFAVMEKLESVSESGWLMMSTYHSLRKFLLFYLKFTGSEGAFLLLVRVALYLYYMLGLLAPPS